VNSSPKGGIFKNRRAYKITNSQFPIILIWDFVPAITPQQRPKPIINYVWLSKLVVLLAKNGE
jgi:hypothetical protein